MTQKTVNLELTAEEVSVFWHYLNGSTATQRAFDANYGSYQFKAKHSHNSRLWGKIDKFLSEQGINPKTIFDKRLRVSTHLVEDITKDGARVGCTYVTTEELEKLLNAIKEAK